MGLTFQLDELKAMKTFGSGLELCTSNARARCNTVETYFKVAYYCNPYCYLLSFMIYRQLQHI
jgi:hypothetical protein